MLSTSLYHCVPILDQFFVVPFSSKLLHYFSSLSSFSYPIQYCLLIHPICLPQHHNKLDVANKKSSFCCSFIAFHQKQSVLFSALFRSVKSICAINSLPVAHLIFCRWIRKIGQSLNSARPALALNHSGWNMTAFEENGTGYFNKHKCLLSSLKVNLHALNFIFHSFEIC